MSALCRKHKQYLIHTLRLLLEYCFLCLFFLSFIWNIAFDCVVVSHFFLSVCLYFFLSLFQCDASNWLSQAMSQHHAMTIFQFSRVKQKRFQFDMPVWLDRCFSLLKTYIKWKPFSFFSLLNFTFTSTASYWGQIWCGHAARFLVFIAQLRVVAVYYVIFCMMKFNRLIIML